MRYRDQSSKPKMCNPSKINSTNIGRIILQNTITQRELEIDIYLGIYDVICLQRNLYEPSYFVLVTSIWYTKYVHIWYYLALQPEKRTVYIPIPKHLKKLKHKFKTCILYIKLIVVLLLSPESLSRLRQRIWT